MSSSLARATRIGAVTVVLAGAAWITAEALAGMLVVHVVSAVLHPMVRMVAGN